MKITATFKDPDFSLSTDCPRQQKAAKGLLQKFLDDDEYIYLEIDTETRTVKLKEK